MKRHHDWEVRLVDYVVPLMGAGFAWGRLDCALFAAGAVQAMTGEDLAKGWRGYRTLAGGMRKLSEAGFEDHVALAASLLEEVPPSLAFRGDVAVVQGDPGLALGIVQGEAVYVMRPSGGIGLVPILSALRAFRVPFPIPE
jgi:hypothetical protein